MKLLSRIKRRISREPSPTAPNGTAYTDNDARGPAVEDAAVQDQFVRQVFTAELDEISKRRAHLQLPQLAPKLVQPISAAPNTNLSLIGLALSGGGIRSATFNLGFLQAMAEAEQLHWIDYLSTVSGGGYIGCCLSTLLNCPHLDTTKSKFPLQRSSHRTPAVRRLEDGIEYLAPDRRWGKMTMAAALIQGVITNSVVIPPYVFVAASVTYLICKAVSAFNIDSGKDFFFTPVRPERETFPFSITAVFWMSITYVVVSMLVACWCTIRRDADLARSRAPGERFFRFLSNGSLCLFILAQPWAVANFYAAWSHSRDLVVACLLLATLIAVLSGVISLIWLGRVAPLLWSLRGTLVASFYVLYLGICSWLMFSLKPMWLGDNVLLAMPASQVWQSGKLLLMVGLAAFIVIFIWPLININHTSLHDFYKFRLSEAYLFRQDSEGHIHAGPSEVLKLSALATRGQSAPLHLINATLNLHNSKSASVRREPGESFVFAKRYSGSMSTGYIETAMIERADATLDLGTAMAISGAALSPNMGSLTMRPIVALMSLLNVRLGYWLQNPANLRGGLKPRSEGPTPTHFLYELFSRMDERGQFVFATDGGHFENLGAFELLRRRCAIVFVGDAEADPLYGFGGLRKLIFLASRELDIEVEISEEQLQEIAAGSRHYAIGKIIYPECPPGKLIYLKASVSADEGALINGYRKAHPKFPHEPTSDQFFSDLQFHCYRELGYRAASKMLAELASGQMIELISTDARKDRAIRAARFREAEITILNSRFPEEIERHLCELAFKLSSVEPYGDVEHILWNSIFACQAGSFVEIPIYQPKPEHREYQLKGLAIILRRQANHSPKLWELIRKVASTERVNDFDDWCEALTPWVEDSDAPTA